MHHLTTLLAASTLATWAFANPLPVANSKVDETGRKVGAATNSTSGTILQTAEKVPKSGPAALAAVYAKYNKPMTKNQAAAANSSSSSSSSSITNIKAGTVVASPGGNDAEYLCPVNVGGQTLNLDFDTGSSDLWVFSSSLPASSQTGHNIYNPAKSTTAKKIAGASWNINYADGSGASGIVYNDTVTLGSLAIPNQAVEVATSVSDEYVSDTTCDGLFGLGFSSINTITPGKRTDYFFTAIQQKALNISVFTADLKKGKPGSYDFGTIDSTKYTGAITYTNVDSSKGYWGFTASGYGIGSTYTATAMAGIADTGTSLLLLPDAVVNAYWAKVSGATYDNNYGAYTYPCSATLPTFTVGIGSARYTLPGTYLNYGPVSSTTCYGGLQTSAGIGFNIYGDIFLKGVFVVFDATVPRIGFANKNL